MRPILLSLATVLFFTFTSVGGVRAADDDRRDKGKYGRNDKDEKEYFKNLRKRQHEVDKRFERQERENRRQYEQQVRENDRGRGAYYPNQAYPSGPIRYRQSGYRGYYPVAPQLGGYGISSNSLAVPYLNGQIGAIVNPFLGSAGTYGGYGVPTPVNPPVPYAPGPVTSYQDDVSTPLVSPYLTGQDPSVPFAPDSVEAYPEPGNPVVPPPPLGSEPPVNVAPTGGQITALADQLVAQANAFLQAFLPKIGIVPESQRFMADATALRNAAARLREVAAAGADPGVLATEFRAVAASWQRFEARMARVSKGRIGPTIATSLQMGETIEQIRRLLP